MTSAHIVRRFPQVAILVRLAAFLIALASVVVIPCAFAAAAARHVSGGTALTTTGLFVVLTLAATLAARRLDPLRG